MGQQDIKQNHHSQYGIVSARDEKNYRVKVRINLLDLETDFIRVGSFYAGAGWGFKALPKVGTEVLVEFPNGDLNEGTVTWQYYSDAADQPPSEEDEPCLIHESGSKMIFRANGDIVIEAKNNLFLRGANVHLNDK